tara:strand:- start:80 stop:493 length:414 start_codon:yes stop_codon:yes gene_type:complete
MENSLNQRYAQFQMLQQHIEQITQHVELLNQQNSDLEIYKDAINQLQKVNVDTEILAPIARGIFIKSVLKDNQKLIVNVGANVTVEKTVPEVVNLLEEQKRELTKKIVEAEVMLQEFQNQAMKIYQDIEKSQIPAES